MVLGQDITLGDRLVTLERQMARLKDDRSIGAVFDGKLSLKWPVRIQGPNGDAYIIIRTAGGTLSSVPAAEYTDSLWVDGSMYDSLPIGAIWGYEGSEDDIPAGWFICDGENGTPDLTGYFIFGGALADVGTVAGTQGTALADHEVSQPGVAVLATNDNTTINDPGSGGTVKDVSLNIHLHDTIVAGADVDAHQIAYYVLAFIKKVA